MIEIQKLLNYQPLVLRLQLFQKRKISLPIVRPLSLLLIANENLLRAGNLADYG